MPIEHLYELDSDDYSQSANTLFNFMKEPQYLDDILIKKAIIPRYCLEDVAYLHITNNGIPFNEILVLQKCFCDIPFHKLTEKLHLKGIGENFQTLSPQEQDFVSQNNTHPDFYGQYGIAFPKSWSEKNNLQPIHYLNESSQYTLDFSNLLQQIMLPNDLPDICSEDIISRLAYIKPLRGKMTRRIKCQDDKIREIDFLKNFHDEKEWRYVPDPQSLSETHKDAIIANPNYIKISTKPNSDFNKELTKPSCSKLWLKYDYEDIRYLIVPNFKARQNLINTILALPSENFPADSDISMQKYILISKILVLNEIRKDW